MNTSNECGWNIFAQVLQEILAARGLGLGHLDDRAHLHSEKVRRLQRSLVRPKNLPLLNIEDMQKVIEVFHLTPVEITRLRAAILATSIEATLMSRISPQDALAAAQQILPIIEQALTDHDREPAGIGAVKSEHAGGSSVDDQLDEALARLDQGMLALHLSRSAERHLERVERAQEATQRFDEALALFDDADPLLRATEVWQVWHAEAIEGRAAARLRLRALGA